MAVGVTSIFSISRGLIIVLQDASYVCNFCWILQGTSTYANSYSHHTIHWVSIYMPMYYIYNKLNTKFILPDTFHITFNEQHSEIPDLLKIPIIFATMHISVLSKCVQCRHINHSTD